MNNKIGALWQKTSSKGLVYFSGVIESPNKTAIPVIIFANTRKNSPKQPDFEVYLQEPREQNSYRDTIAEAQQIENANNL